MPFYGPQCEHKAPGKDKQIEVEEIQSKLCGGNITLWFGLLLLINMRLTTFVVTK